MKPTVTIEEAVERFKGILRDELAATQKSYDAYKAQFAEALKINRLHYAIEWKAEGAVHAEQALALLTPLASFVDDEQAPAVLVERVRMWRDEAVRRIVTQNPDITSSGWGLRLAGWGAWQAQREFAEMLSDKGLSRVGYAFAQLERAWDAGEPLPEEGEQL